MMDYKFSKISIKELVELIDRDKVDLSPSYQRNFIWSTKDQSELIDTIIKGFPLPTFFLFKKPSGFFEMVDGQQRSRTIFSFVKGKITSSIDTGKLYFSECDQNVILNYQLPFIIIHNLSSGESLNDFYVLINKKGKHLNTPELYKSEFFGSNFFKLAESVLSYQGLIDLNLFSNATTIRMNDRFFVEELLAYLKYGIGDKRSHVEFIYQKADITPEEVGELENRFFEVVDLLVRLNEIFPINKTRYKQKNDFYTLFNFISENIDLKFEIIEKQYKILLLLNQKDGEGDQLIRPSNEECIHLREYALNCVSQSNSKDARKKRLSFFNSMLMNRGAANSKPFIEVVNYLASIFGKENIDVIEIDGFSFIEDKLNY